MMMMMMDVWNEYPSELEIGSSMESLEKLMESQKQLVHKQIDQLQNIVNTQCKLTGVNPLSQEMAAGALSIKIGKRPRDMLNSKAVKYMQSVFSVKDAISKKESREISALFGVTVTQVREYFANQRSRVRKMVRLSREKAIRANIDRELQDGMLATSDPMLPLDPVPLSSVGPSSAEEAPSCSNQDEVFPGLGESEKQFVENIFSSMCKEETFSGQVKLMEWILLIENPSVLCWFLTKGGVMILATWLSQAASEEQTTVLSVALKVLCHLPLHKAVPTHMSAILQAVNKLRFYRISDISNRARFLLSKWSKMLCKSQASRKPNGIKYAAVQERDLRQRIGELIGDDSWQSSVDNPETALVPSYAGGDDTRKMETQQAVKLLTASSDDSSKKHILGTSAIQNKERRKVLLVEQPGQKAAAKGQQVKAVAANQRRPITADEIQKAKLRAQLMQSNKMKSEGPKKPSLLTNDFLSASEAYLRPKLEAQKKARILPPKISKQVESVSDQKPSLGPKESLLDKCRWVQIPWQAPPEIPVNAAWEVGTGGNSKEIEVQKNRIRREKETIYQTLQEVPPNPKEPWDMEMDHDDSLTPEIPIEQLPDADADMGDTPLGTHLLETQNPSVVLPNPASTSSLGGSGAALPEPDLELLAVLLKNPGLVFALAKGEAGLSNEDTVKLLDMLKSNGGLGLLNGAVGANPMEKVEVSLPSPTPHRDVEVSLPSPTPPNRFEVSLPSPTPSSDPGPSEWASQAAAAKNPFSRHSTTPFPGVQIAVITSDRFQSNCTMQSQIPSVSTVPPLPHQQSSRFPISVPRASSSIPETQPTFFSPAPTQIPPPVINHLVTSSYLMSSPAISQPEAYAKPHMPDPYEIPEGSNRAMLNSRHGSVPNSFSTRVDQNGCDSVSVGGHGRGSVALPGTSWERNDFYRGPQNGFESWSPENSPSRYPPDYNHQGGGWSYQDQRARGYGHGPPDRHSRHHNSLGFRDQNWHGGGGGSGGNRRWQDSDRRW